MGKLDMNQGKQGSLMLGLWLCLDRVWLRALEIKLNSLESPFLFECYRSGHKTETLKENMWLWSLDQVYNANCRLYFICSLYINY